MRKLAMALAVAGISASAEGQAQRQAQTQGQGAPAARVAPQAVYDVAPSLRTYTDEVLFGEVWRREGLAGTQPRHRRRPHRKRPRRATARHVGRALDNDVKPDEIAEALPISPSMRVAISAVQETRAVFEQRGIGTPAPAGELLPLDEAAEARRREAVQDPAGAVLGPGWAQA